MKRDTQVSQKSQLILEETRSKKIGPGSSQLELLSCRVLLCTFNIILLVYAAVPVVVAHAMKSLYSYSSTKVSSSISSSICHRFTHHTHITHTHV